MNAADVVENVLPAEVAVAQGTFRFGSDFVETRHSTKETTSYWQLETSLDCY